MASANVVALQIYMFAHAVYTDKIHDINMYVENQILLTGYTRLATKNNNFPGNEYSSK